MDAARLWELFKYVEEPRDSPPAVTPVVLAIADEVRSASANDFEQRLVDELTDRRENWLEIRDTLRELMTRCTSTGTLDPGATAMLLNEADALWKDLYGKSARRDAGVTDPGRPAGAAARVPTDAELRAAFESPEFVEFEKRAEAWAVAVAAWMRDLSGRSGFVRPEDFVRLDGALKDLGTALTAVRGLTPETDAMRVVNTKQAFCRAVAVAAQVQASAFSAAVRGEAERVYRGTNETILPRLRRWLGDERRPVLAAIAAGESLDQFISSHPPGAWHDVVAALVQDARLGERKVAAGDPVVRLCFDVDRLGRFRRELRRSPELAAFIVGGSSEDVAAAIDGLRQLSGLFRREPSGRLLTDRGLAVRLGSGESLVLTEKQTLQNDILILRPDGDGYLLEVSGPLVAWPSDPPGQPPTPLGAWIRSLQIRRVGPGGPVPVWPTGALVADGDGLNGFFAARGRYLDLPDGWIDSAAGAAEIIEVKPDAVSLRFAPALFGARPSYTVTVTPTYYDTNLEEGLGQLRNRTEQTLRTAAGADPVVEDLPDRGHLRLTAPLGAWPRALPSLLPNSRPVADLLARVSAPTGGERPPLPPDLPFPLSLRPDGSVEGAAAIAGADAVSVLNILGANGGPLFQRIRFVEPRPAGAVGSRQGIPAEWAKDTILEVHDAELVPEGVRFRSVTPLRLKPTAASVVLQAGAFLATPAGLTWLKPPAGSPPLRFGGPEGPVLELESLSADAGDDTLAFEGLLRVGPLAASGLRVRGRLSPRPEDFGLTVSGLELVNGDEAKATIADELFGPGRGISLEPLALRLDPEELTLEISGLQVGEERFDESPDRSIVVALDGSDVSGPGRPHRNLDAAVAWLAERAAPALLRRLDLEVEPGAALRIRPSGGGVRFGASAAGDGPSLSAAGSFSLEVVHADDAGSPVPGARVADLEGEVSLSPAEDGGAARTAFRLTGRVASAADLFGFVGLAGVERVASVREVTLQRPAPEAAADPESLAITVRADLAIPGAGPSGGPLRVNDVSLRLRSPFGGDSAVDALVASVNDVLHAAESAAGEPAAPASAARLVRLEAPADASAVDRIGLALSGKLQAGSGLFVYDGLVFSLGRGVFLPETGALRFRPGPAGRRGGGPSREDVERWRAELARLRGVIDAWSWSDAGSGAALATHVEALERLHAEVSRLPDAPPGFVFSTPKRIENSLAGSFWKRESSRLADGLDLTLRAAHERATSDRPERAFSAGDRDAIVAYVEDQLSEAAGVRVAGDAQGEGWFEPELSVRGRRRSVVIPIPVRLAPQPDAPVERLYLRIPEGGEAPPDLYFERFEALPAAPRPESLAGLLAEAVRDPAVAPAADDLLKSWRSGGALRNVGGVPFRPVAIVATPDSPPQAALRGFVELPGLIRVPADLRADPASPGGWRFDVPGTAAVEVVSPQLGALGAFEIAIPGDAGAKPLVPSDAGLPLRIRRAAAADPARAVATAEVAVTADGLRFVSPDGKPAPISAESLAQELDRRSAAELAAALADKPIRVDAFGAAVEVSRLEAVPGVPGAFNLFGDAVVGESIRLPVQLRYQDGAVESAPAAVVTAAAPSAAAADPSAEGAGTSGLAPSTAGEGLDKLVPYGFAFRLRQQFADAATGTVPGAGPPLLRFDIDVWYRLPPGLLLSKDTDGDGLADVSFGEPDAAADDDDVVSFTVRDLALTEEGLRSGWAASVLAALDESLRGRVLSRPGEAGSFRLRIDRLGRLKDLAPDNPDTARGPDDPALAATFLFPHGLASRGASGRLSGNALELSAVFAVAPPQGPVPLSLRVLPGTLGGPALQELASELQSFFSRLVGKAATGVEVRPAADEIDLQTLRVVYDVAVQWRDPQPDEPAVFTLEFGADGLRFDWAAFFEPLGRRTLAAESKLREIVEGLFGGAVRRHGEAAVGDDGFGLVVDLRRLEATVCQLELRLICRGRRSRPILVTVDLVDDVMEVFDGGQSSGVLPPDRALAFVANAMFARLEEGGVRPVFDLFGVPIQLDRLHFPDAGPGEIGPATDRLHADVRVLFGGAERDTYWRWRLEVPLRDGPAYKAYQLEEPHIGSDSLFLPAETALDASSRLRIVPVGRPDVQSDETSGLPVLFRQRLLVSLDRIVDGRSSQPIRREIDVTYTRRGPDRDDILILDPPSGEVVVLGDDGAPLVVVRRREGSPLLWANFSRAWIVFNGDATFSGGSKYGIDVAFNGFLVYAVRGIHDDKPNKLPNDLGRGLLVGRGDFAVGRNEKVLGTAELVADLASKRLAASFPAGFKSGLGSTELFAGGRPWLFVDLPTSQIALKASIDRPVKVEAVRGKYFAEQSVLAIAAAPIELQLVDLPVPATVTVVAPAALITVAGVISTLIGEFDLFHIYLDDRHHMIFSLRARSAYLQVNLGEPGDGRPSFRGHEVAQFLPFGAFDESEWYARVEEALQRELPAQVPSPAAEDLAGASPFEQTAEPSSDPAGTTPGSAPSPTPATTPAPSEEECVVGSPTRDRWRLLVLFGSNTHIWISDETKHNGHFVELHYDRHNRRYWHRWTISDFKCGGWRIVEGVLDIAWEGIEAVAEYVVDTLDWAIFGGFGLWGGPDPHPCDVESCGFDPSGPAGGSGAPGLWLPGGAATPAGNPAHADLAAVAAAPTGTDGTSGADHFASTPTESELGSSGAADGGDLLFVGDRGVDPAEPGRPSEVRLLFRFEGGLARDATGRLAYDARYPTADPEAVVLERLDNGRPTGERFARLATAVPDPTLPAGGEVRIAQLEVPDAVDDDRAQLAAWLRERARGAGPPPPTAATAAAAEVPDLLLGSELLGRPPVTVRAGTAVTGTPAEGGERVVAEELPAWVAEACEQERCLLLGGDPPVLVAWGAGAVTAFAGRERHDVVPQADTRSSWFADGRRVRGLFASPEIVALFAGDIGRWPRVRTAEAATADRPAWVLWESASDTGRPVYQLAAGFQDSFGVVAVPESVDPTTGIDPAWVAAAADRAGRVGGSTLLLPGGAAGWSPAPGGIEFRCYPGGAPGYSSLLAHDAAALLDHDPPAAVIAALMRELAPTPPGTTRSIVGFAKGRFAVAADEGGPVGRLVEQAPDDPGRARVLQTDLAAVRNSLEGLGAAASTRSFGESLKSAGVSADWLKRAKAGESDPALLAPLLRAALAEPADERKGTPLPARAFFRAGDGRPALESE